MGDTNVSQELTTYDKISVFLYRGGIIISMLCIVLASIGFYGIVNGNTESFVLQGNHPQIIFWTFFISVGVSLLFLHLYSKEVLQIIRSFYLIGAAILLYLAFTKLSGQFIPGVFTYWLGVVGLGFLMAGFSGIGAKEAYCFKLLEGYLYGMVSALLVLLHLIGVIAQITHHLKWVELTLFMIITVLVVVFTVRKLRLPLHYDIGDKTKY